MAPATRTSVAFTKRVLDAIRTRGSLRIRAGSAPHRFIGIWGVVVDGRVFVRSWNDKPKGWYRAWRADPVGAIEVEKREIAVRAKAVRGEKLLDAISAAYREKFTGPGSRTYVEGMDSAKRRATTLELVPATFVTGSRTARTA